MSHHEIDGLGRDEFGRHEQVALVFAVFLVHQYHHSAGAQLVDDFGDRGNAGGTGRIGVQL